MEFRHLYPGEMQEWSNLCREVFNKETGREHGNSFLEMYESDPWKDQNSILVAVDNGKIVSTVQIYCRFTALGSQEIKTAFIGGVCTHPDYRGQGLASRLLNDAVNIMNEQDFTISMLTSGIGDFYKRLGWKDVDWNWKTANFKVDNTSAEELIVRPIDLKDIDSIKNIHANHVLKFNGPIIRNHDEYWDQRIQMQHKPCWVATDKGGNVLAYLWLYVREEDNYICVIEYGESVPNVFDRMVNRICSSFGWANCRLRTQSGVRFGFKTSETATYSGLMYRLIKPIKVQNESIQTTEQLISFINQNNNPESSIFLIWDHENV